MFWRGTRSVVHLGGSTDVLYSLKHYSQNCLYILDSDFVFVHICKYKLIQQFLLLQIILYALTYIIIFVKKKQFI